MSNGPFVLTAEERDKLEAAMLESRKVLEGIPGALVDVRRRAFREAATMAEGEAEKWRKKRDLLAGEKGNEGTMWAAAKAETASLIAARLRAEAEKGEE